VAGVGLVAGQDVLPLGVVPAPRMGVCGYCGEPVVRPARTHEACQARAAEERAASQRRCPKCRKVKALSRYPIDPDRVDGHGLYCVGCVGELSTHTQTQNAARPATGAHCPLCDAVLRGNVTRRWCSTTCRSRADRLWRRYGLRVEQYRALVDATGGRCPVCDKRCNTWQVDHDHRSGLVLGVCCAPCNTGLVADSRHQPARARGLLNYLEHPPAAALGIVVHVPAGARARTPNTGWRPGGRR
jgi:hypothetical protein